MEFINKDTIKLNKIPNELDKFVVKFIDILKQNVDYVIISGYVSILFGRARGTEDIDVFIKKIDKSQFQILYENLKKNGYWCLNAENIDEIYDYLEDGVAVRFAIKDETIPNFEVKFAIKPESLKAFDDRITVKMSIGELFVSSLERQIAYKKYYLGSDKDLEDARHIEELFKDHIDQFKVEEYKRLIQ